MLLLESNPMRRRKMNTSQNFSNEIQVSPENNYTQILKEFMKQHGLHKVIGFSGGSDDTLHGIPAEDELQIKHKAFRNEFDKRIVVDALNIFKDHRVAILSGGTKWGVPRLACEYAKKFGFKTIGVYPKTGKKYALDDSLLDLSFCVEPIIGESHWGDECPLWVSMCDGIIVIGGGAGTLTECAHIQKINESLVKYGRTPKYLVPIHGSGGVAEKLPHSWAKPEIKTVSMPSDRVHTGSDAAHILIDRLHLYDFYDHHYHQETVHHPTNN